LLSRKLLLHDLGAGHIAVVPFDETRLRPASYVLSLGSRFRRWHGALGSISLWSVDACRDHLDEPFEAEELTIMPGEFVLGCTTEKIGIAFDRYGIISPLSHISRFGLGLHGGADFINPGFGIATPTHLTLELHNYNSSPLALKAGMPIAHFRVGMLEGPATTSRPHKSAYEGADPVTAPRLYEEWSGFVSVKKDV